MCTFGTRSGIGHHTDELVRALRARIAPEALSVYPQGAAAVALRFWGRHVQRYLVRRQRPGVLAWIEAVARRSYLAAIRRTGSLLAPDPFTYALGRKRYDLYHEPNFLAYPCDLPTVVTVHDLSVLLHPEWHPARRVAEFARAFDRTLQRACHLLTVSESVKREIVEHLGWPPERVTVTYNGRRPFLRPLAPDEYEPIVQKFGLVPGYFLHVGTVEPRKNLAMLLEAHTALPAAVRRKHPLVVVGGVGWQSNDLENELSARRHDGTVRRVGYCPDEVLAAMYSAARALVFPTFYEGFGMPTVEMMACGGAVLASTAPAVAETVGGTAHLIDPHDTDGWRAAMLRACTDHEWWMALRRGAEEAARPFTWDACARSTLDAYQRALGKVDVGTKRAA
jgi:alpha-1,3-rhamnosyl/mannosyltransferase